MTLAEILALPVQARKRIITETGTGHEYLIPKGLSGSSAKRMIALSDLEQYDSGFITNPIAAGLSKINDVGLEAADVPNYFVQDELTGNWTSNLFVDPYSFIPPLPDRTIAYDVGQSRWIMTKFSDPLIVFRSPIVLISNSPFGLTFTQTTDPGCKFELSSYAGQPGTPSLYSGQEKLALGSWFKNFGNSVTPYWKIYNSATSSWDLVNSVVI